MRGRAWIRRTRLVHPQAAPTCRHAEGWAALTAAEAAGFGPIAQRVAVAIETAIGAAMVYLLSFGEQYPHFHFLVVARAPSLASDLRGPAILALLADQRDPEASLAVAAEVRAALIAAEAGE